MKKSSEFGITEIVEISALEKKSVEGLVKKFSNAFDLVDKPGSTVVTNLRHYEFLSQALIYLVEVEKGLENRWETLKEIV